MKLKKIKLNELSKAELDEREMCRLLGGLFCTCGCVYVNYGGSSSSSNSSANNDAPPPPPPPQSNCSCIPQDGTLLLSVSMCSYGRPY